MANDLIARVRAAKRAGSGDARTSDGPPTSGGGLLRGLRPQLGRGAAYAGIGSRQTPPAVLEAMRRIAQLLNEEGWTLRSGGADGADSAFESGAAPNQRTIYVPWEGYNGIERGEGRRLGPAEDRKAEAIAAAYHPAWERCGRGARRLHARNAAIILGAKLDDPVDAVVCWTPGGRTTGGTATGIRMAQAIDEPIPVFNLATMSEDEVIEALLRVGAERTATIDAAIEQ